MTAASGVIHTLNKKTAVVVAEIYRKSAKGWNCKAIGNGMKGGYYTLCQKLNVN